MNVTHPATGYEQLHKQILNDFASYSKAFKVLARTVIDKPHLVALHNIVYLARTIGVSTGTIMRFITFHGYDGYSDFQNIFKQNLVSQFHNYQESITKLPADKNDPYNLLHEIHNLTTSELASLVKDTNPQLLDAIVKKLNLADTIYVCAFRRLYPVSTYMYYTLAHSGLNVSLIDGKAGMQQEQAKQMCGNDVLVLMSMHPYSSEAQQVANIAQLQNVPMVIVTDSQLSPLYPLSDLCLVVSDLLLRNIRIPIALMSILLALCLALGYCRQSRNNANDSA